jgi:hypothetical protein
MMLNLLSASLLLSSLVGVAHGWQSSAMAPRSSLHTTAPRAPRAHVRLNESGEGLSDMDFTADFSAQLLKMPRLLDPQRASYEIYRERKNKETAKNLRSGVVSTEEINDDSSEPVYDFRHVEPGPLATPIPYDIEIDLMVEDEEDAYEVNDLSTQDTNAADNYLNSL